MTRFISPKAAAVFGSTAYPSIALRLRPTDGAWELRLNNSTQWLGPRQVSKGIALPYSSYTYSIELDSQLLAIDLEGTPPNRSGVVKTQGRPPVAEETLARLTCH